MRVQGLHVIGGDPRVPLIQRAANVKFDILNPFCQHGFRDMLSVLAEFGNCAESSVSLGACDLFKNKRGRQDGVTICCPVVRSDSGKSPNESGTEMHDVAHTLLTDSEYTMRW